MAYVCAGFKISTFILLLVFRGQFGIFFRFFCRTFGIVIFRMDYLFWVILDFVE